jgi:microcin C transport system substrate-binding protein
MKNAGRTIISAASSCLLAALAVPGLTAQGRAETAAATPVQRHALSLVGEPRFPANFKSFDWVNPEAPKGGAVKMWSEGGFDSLNPFTKNGEGADQLGLLFDRIMESSPDEPTTQYCLICEWVSYPDDYSSVTFKLRPQARFADGHPITVDDVIFSLEAQKKADPQMLHYYSNVTCGKQTGPNEVTFAFDSKGNRELPQIVGELTVLPKHFWTGKDANGQTRDLSKTTLEIPLGSGPYKVGTVDRGRSITYVRNKDWWAKDLPATTGLYNFDEIKIEYYRDRTPAFEAFKTGAIDVWPENSAKSWATDYDFPAVTKGLVKKDVFAQSRVAPMQAFVMNLRRPQFEDLRTRRAFNLAFNFEAMNQQLLYSQYTRTASFFDNSELKSSGLPQGRELEILNDVKDQVPPEVFTQEYKNPVGGSDADMRRNLSAASKLLLDAGWTVQGRQLVSKQGQPFRIEILLNSQTFEKHASRYADDLKKLGIDASVRVVDSAQYQRRVQSFDYDVIVGGFAQSISPGNEQRNYWGSKSAETPGSRNLVGIKNPAVDKLIDRIVFSKDRADLVAATHALDRVLLWNAYVVPQWYYPSDRLAHWDRFGRPSKTPSQGISFLSTWWYDKAAADRTAQAGRGQ